LLSRPGRSPLDLIEDGRGPKRFDSGNVPWGGTPRRIDIDLAESAFACFDRVYSLHARRPPASARVQGMRTEPVTLPVAPAP
jgi:predicted RNA methylase